MGTSLDHTMHPQISSITLPCFLPSFGLTFGTLNEHKLI